MKKSSTAKILAILLALVTLMSAFPASVLAASWPSVSSSAYCEFIASKNINVYRYSSCQTRGTCSPARSYDAYAETGDKCRIIEMSASFFKIQYPTPSGYKTGFVKRWDVVSVSSPTNVVKSAGQAKTYTKPGGSEYGYVAKNDQTYVCGEANGYVAVIYPSKSSNRAYKLGYVKSSDYNNIIAPSGTPKVSAKKTIANGTYYICSALNTNMCLDCAGWSTNNGANVFLWTCSNANNQKLKVTYLNNGYYKLEFVHSGKCLDVAEVSYKSGANVHQWTYGGGTNQQWIIADAGNGYYYIVARHSGKFLDVAGGKTASGTNVQVYDGNRTNAQKFKFVSVSANNSTNNTTSTGNFKTYNGVNYTSILKNALSSGKISNKEYNNRISVLTEAQKMVTLIWTAPVSFHTWRAGNGSYNSNKSMLYSGSSSSNNQFVKGCTYVGIPYAANAGYNNYGVNEWQSLIKESGIASSKLEGTVTYSSKTRYNCTYRGIDCSGFVHKAYITIGSYNFTDKNRLGTSGMLSSSYWKKIDVSEALPGDILLKSGHVMIFIGKTSNGKIAVMESVADGKNGYSGCRYYEFSASAISSSYGYYRYTKISQ